MGPPLVGSRINPSLTPSESTIDFKLQEEYCERWVADAGEIRLMLLCENASLSRLSIRIFVVPASGNHNNQELKTRSRTNPIDPGGLYHIETI